MRAELVPVGNCDSYEVRDVEWTPLPRFAARQVEVSGLGTGLGGKLQAERAVGPIRVVIGDALAPEGTQVPLVEDNDVVEALAPQGSDHPLGHRVRARGSDRSKQGCGPEHLGTPGKLRAVDAVTVPDKIARCPAPRRRLNELTPDPGGGRVRSDMHMDQLTPSVGDEHQGGEGSERQRRYGEKVSGPDLGPMVGEERAPGLARWADRAASLVPLNPVLAHGYKAVV